MAIRPAILADANAIFEIALEEASSYEKLFPDEGKIRKGITIAISSAKHFAWVSESDGRIEGVLIGLVSENLWAQRSNCLIAIWKSRIVGDGLRMMRAFFDWVKHRRAIRIAGIVPDSNAIDPRALRLAEYLGFERTGGMYLYYN
jgi:hypothetical protein